jgi:hypothetical protein
MLRTDYELVSSHAEARRGRPRGLMAAVSLVAGALALAAVALSFGREDAGGASSHSRMRQRDALLGGPPAASKSAPPAQLRLDRAQPATESLAYVAHIHQGGRVLFDKEKQSREIQAYVNGGHMKCCVRNDHDLEDEVYPKYYDDFPLDPMCIPGYRKDGDDCIACDEGYYCPAKEDRVMKCPERTWAPLGSGEVTECWCAEGYYGKEPSLQAGADCHICPVDKFCPGFSRLPTVRG